jgi:hypothetical protein
MADCTEANLHILVFLVMPGGTNQQQSPSIPGGGVTNGNHTVTSSPGHCRGSRIIGEVIEMEAGLLEQEHVGRWVSAPPLEEELCRLSSCRILNRLP